MLNFEEWHNCHFCGTEVNKNGYEYNGARHYLSDCRPDLVEHPIGDTCTWIYESKAIASSVEGREFPCYAYQDKDGKWTREHIHFYPDGPM